MTLTLAELRREKERLEADILALILNFESKIESCSSITLKALVLTHRADIHVTKVTAEVRVR